MSFDELTKFVKNILEIGLGIKDVYWEERYNASISEMWSRPSNLSIVEIDFLSTSLKILNVEVRKYSREAGTSILLNVVYKPKTKELYVNISPA